MVSKMAQRQILPVEIMGWPFGDAPIKPLQGSATSIQKSNCNDSLSRKVTPTHRHQETVPVR